jgi:hypothetical protein
VLVPRYKLSLFHTPIKPDLLGFPGIGVFACGLRDNVITRFASQVDWKTCLFEIIIGNYIHTILLQANCMQEKNSNG